MARDLQERLFEIGIRPSSVKNGEIPGSVLLHVLYGKSLLIVIKGPDLCQCCHKPQVRAFVMPKLSRPLEELFR